MKHAGVDAGRTLAAGPLAPIFQQGVPVPPGTGVAAPALARLPRRCRESTRPPVVSARDVGARYGQRPLERPSGHTTDPCRVPDARPAHSGRRIPGGPRLCPWAGPDVHGATGRTARAGALPAGGCWLHRSGGLPPGQPDSSDGALAVRAPVAAVDVALESRGGHRAAVAAAPAAACRM